jgi:hypothetical protein
MGEKTFVIRAAVCDNAGHFPECLIGERPGFFRNYSYESAHGYFVILLFGDLEI